MAGSGAAAAGEALSTGRFYFHETSQTQEIGMFSGRGKPGDLLPADPPPMTAKGSSQGGREPEGGYGQCEPSLAVVSWVLYSF